MPVTLGSIATSGFPEGTYAMRIDSVEAGRNAANTGDTMIFKGTCVQSDNTAVKPGAKQTWSYTYMDNENISILGNQLVKVGLDRNMLIEKNARLDAPIYDQLMRNNTYMIQVIPQKRDPSRMNTFFVGPYGATVGSAPAPAPAPAPVPVAAPAPVAAAPAPVASNGTAGGPQPVASVAPAPAAAAPAPVAPVAPAAVAPAVAPATSVAPVAPPAPQLDPTLVAQVMAAQAGQGTYPPLMPAQIAVLRTMIGMVPVADMYEAALKTAAAADAGTAFSQV